MISAHLPALQVVVPLIAAPVCALMRRGRLAWLLALVVTWVAFAIALALLARVLAEGTISYEMGGWAVPWGIEYRLDTLNAFVLVIIAGMGAAVLPCAYHSVRAEIPADRRWLFYTAFLLVETGLFGAVITGDVFNLYVFVEIASLASYTLVALGNDRRALTAAYQYLVLGTIAATFILIGVGLLYMMTGTLNMADLALRLDGIEDARPVRAALAFLTVGIALKLALIPLHFWLPNAYTYAPSVVSAFLAATSTKVGAYILLRFLFTVFGKPFSFDTMPVGEVLMALALVAMLVGSLVAIFQSNIKRMLAYSTLAQIGYIALGISFASETGLIGAIVHVFNHALMKGALFLAMAGVALKVGAVDLESMAGLGRRMPLTMAAFVTAGLSLVGVPPTVGFVSKWYLVLASLERGLWPVAVLVLVSSVLALVYVWRVVEVAYFRPAPEEAEARSEAPASLWGPTLALAALSVVFGIYTKFTVGVAQQAAVGLLGGIP